MKLFFDCASCFEPKLPDWPEGGSLIHRVMLGLLHGHQLVLSEQCRSLTSLVFAVLFPSFSSSFYLLTSCSSLLWKCGSSSQFKHTRKKLISSPVTKARGAIRCLFTNVLTMEKPLTWISYPRIHTHNGSHWIQSDRKLIQNSCFSGRGPFGLIERVCVCVCLCVCASAELSTVAQSSVGFVEFPGVAGFAVLLRAGLPKVLSLNCERICC